MNPEENNPIANPGVSGTGAVNDPMNMVSSNGLTMADGLASAQDNLTSAGLAASTGAGLMDLNQLGATAPEAVIYEVFFIGIAEFYILPSLEGDFS